MPPYAVFGEWHKWKLFWIEIRKVYNHTFVHYKQNRFQLQRRRVTTTTSTQKNRVCETTHLGRGRHGRFLTQRRCGSRRRVSPFTEANIASHWPHKVVRILHLISRLTSRRAHLTQRTLIKYALRERWWGVTRGNWCRYERTTALQLMSCNITEYSYTGRHSFREKSPGSYR